MASGPIIHCQPIRCLIGTFRPPFPNLLPAVEEHVRESLAANPPRGSLWRTQALLCLAEVRAQAGVLDGAADSMSEVLDQLTPSYLQPSIRRRIEDITQTAERRRPRTNAMQPVYERLAAFDA